MIVETNSRIVVFCKASIPGNCKTRLIPHFGSRGAAKIARELLVDTANKVLDQSDYEVELCCTPTISHPSLLSLRRKHPNSKLRLSLQRDEDLGRRMYHAASRVLSTQSSVVIIGTDCPMMTLNYISQAFEKLGQGQDVVIGPAQDGGYVLIGLRIAEIRLFQNIEWGSNKVLQQTLRNCQQLKLHPQLLTPLTDIDYASDWLNWQRQDA